MKRGVCFLCSLFFPEAKREPERKPGTRLGNSRYARPSAGLSLPAKIILRGFSSFFFRSFSFCERKRTKKKAQEPAWAAPLRPSVGGSWFTRKIILRGFSFRKAPQGKTGNEWWERVVRWATFIPPLRFLFFGSFFSFSERKERTDLFPKEKERTATQKAVRGRAVSGRGSSRARWRSAGRGHRSGPGRCAPRAAPRRR